ncbi:MAG: UDP-N-acetylmuramoyl-tripeptide--D-alanyl-D-alanine ligase [Microgenomates group bacterium]
MSQTSWWKKPFHQARRVLAKFWLRFFPHLTIVGITGSYGKTNTTRAIATVLKEKFKTLQTDLNLDTIYNLPITVLKLRPGHQVLVLEYGVDHKNEMDYHLALVKPSIGVVTGINPTHSDPELLGSLKGVIKEKSKLLAALPKNGWAILNWDDKRVRTMAKATKAKVICYGTSTNCDYWAENIKVGFSGTSFVINDQRQKTKVQTGLVGRHFVHACLVAAIVGRLQNLNWEEIASGLAKLKPLKGRLSIERGPRGSILLDDHLRANPASTLAGLQTLVDLPTKGRRIAVLGEMGELGEWAEKEHCRVGQELAKLKKVDYLISVGSLQKLTAMEAIKMGMKKNQVFWTEDVTGATKVLEKLLSPGDLLYLKGSLLRHMERVLLLLEGEKVGCQVVSCHNYWQCQNCPYLLSGPTGIK